ncbi:phage tail protein [Oceanobacillus sp. 1P07AA]|uniref:phage tail protein n=1 Tax=Oceanobacillus sp. 1P07AA TaxID=3132293 RepID=UPI0039A6E9AA
MSELFIFDQKDQLKTIISEDTGLLQTRFREEVNQIPDTPFQFEVEANEDIMKYVKEENQVVFRDRSGDYRLFTIKEIDDTTDMGVSITTATCTSALMELNEHIIEKLNLKDQSLTVALEKIFEKTRWQFQTDFITTHANLDIEYQSSLEAMLMIVNIWGIEFKDTISIDDNNKITRNVSFQYRLGEDNGLRFEIDYNATNVNRTIISYPKTALYGQGGTVDEEIIDFSTVEWKVQNGNPVDKPIGQKWVGDPNALSKYGLDKDGTLMHRQGVFKDTQIEKPEELLEKTWKALILAQQPEVNYQLLVDITGERIQLGDTAICIDRNFARPIEIQTRIIAIEYDVLSSSDTVQVEMGQFLNLHDDRIDKVIEDIDKNREKWESVGTISKDSYPDNKPSPPTNVEAYGAFKTIQIYWDYTDEIYVNAYEVYGSQVKEFEPDSQHLLWKGNVSAFSHIVETDQKWYYYVRAINHHGTASDWSEQVEASTHRVISEDILFGEELAERMRELHNINDIIGTGGVSFEQISQEAKSLINQQASEYTDREISETRDGIMESVSNLTNDLEYVEGQLVDKVNTNDVYTITDIDNMISNKVGLTRYETDYNGVVQDLEQHSSLIEKNEKEIRNRVEQTIFNNETGILRQSISDVQQFAEGIETTVSNIELDVTDNQHRMNQAESTINQLSNEIDLKVDVDNIVSQINLNREGVKIKGNLIHLDGTTLINDGVIQNAHIANGTIERAKLERAIIGEAQIEDLAITSAKIASVNADKINASRLSSISADLGTVRAGRLLSNNNNMDLNLNTGSLTMRNAEFTFGGGAKIQFTDNGNWLYYTNGDVYSGLLFGESLRGNGRPFVSLGVSDYSLSVNDNSFNGIRIHSGWVENNADGVMTNIISNRLWLNSSPSYDGGGWIIENAWTGNHYRTIYGANSASYNYNLGLPGSRFYSIYTDRIEGDNIYFNYPFSGSRLGYIMENTVKSGRNPAFRPQYGGELYYDLGTSYHRWTNIYSQNSLQTPSDERLKEDIEDNTLGLDFIKDIGTITYRLKPIGDNTQKRPIQFGVSAQSFRTVLEKYDVDINDYEILQIGEDGMYGMKYEQLVSPTIKAVQELDRKLEEEKNCQSTNYELLINELNKLMKEIKELKER